MGSHPGAYRDPHTPDLPGSTEEATQAPAGLFPSWPLFLYGRSAPTSLHTHPAPARELIGLLSRGFSLGIPPKNEQPIPVRFQCGPPSATHRTFGPLGSSRDKREGAGERGGREGDKVRRTLSKAVQIQAVLNPHRCTRVRTLQIVHSNIFSYSMSNTSIKLFNNECEENIRSGLSLSGVRWVIFIFCLVFPYNIHKLKNIHFINSYLCILCTSSPDPSEKALLGRFWLSCEIIFRSPCQALRVRTTTSNTSRFLPPPRSQIPRKPHACLLLRAPDYDVNRTQFEHVALNFPQLVLKKENQNEDNNKLKKTKVHAVKTPTQLSRPGQPPSPPPR